MAEMPPRSSNGFTTKFLPGLALGLVVGGLAGAFIPSAMDAVSGPGTGTRVPAGGARPAPAGAAKDRDARPVPPTAPEAAPGEAKPDEVKKPEDEKPPSPPPAAEAPVTPPAPAPK